MWTICGSLGFINICLYSIFSFLKTQYNSSLHFFGFCLIASQYIGELQHLQETAAGCLQAICFTSHLLFMVHEEIRNFYLFLLSLLLGLSIPFLLFLSSSCNQNLARDYMTLLNQCAWPHPIVNRRSCLRGPHEVIQDVLAIIIKDIWDPGLWCFLHVVWRLLIAIYNPEPKWA